MIANVSFVYLQITIMLLVQYFFIILVDNTHLATSHSYILKNIFKINGPIFTTSMLSTTIVVDNCTNNFIHMQLNNLSKHHE